MSDPDDTGQARLGDVAGELLQGGRQAQQPGVGGPYYAIEGVHGMNLGLGASGGNYAA